MLRVRLMPYRQGHLDGLCGLYSVVNAVRFALRTAELRRPFLSPRPRRLTQDEAERLFAALLKSLGGNRHSEGIAVDGVDLNQVAKLLKCAAKWLQAHRAVMLRCSRPLGRRTRVGTKTMLAYLNEHLSKPGSAAIVRATGTWEHWTVATRVTDSRLHLLDSAGDRSMAIKRGKRNFSYHVGLIDPSCLCLISIADDQPARSRRVPDATRQLAEAQHRFVKRRATRARG